MTQEPPNPLDPIDMELYRLISERDGTPNDGRTPHALNANETTSLLLTVREIYNHVKHGRSRLDDHSEKIATLQRASQRPELAKLVQSLRPSDAVKQRLATAKAAIDAMEEAHDWVELCELLGHVFTSPNATRCARCMALPPKDPPINPTHIESIVVGLDGIAETLSTSDPLMGNIHTVINELNRRKASAETVTRRKTVWLDECPRGGLCHHEVLCPGSVR